MSKVDVFFRMIILMKKKVIGHADTDTSQNKSTCIAAR